jgi:hypothetical protein
MGYQPSALPSPVQRSYTSGVITVGEIYGRFADLNGITEA